MGCVFGCPRKWKEAPPCSWDDEAAVPPLPFSPKAAKMMQAMLAMQARHPSLLSRQGDPDVPARSRSPRIGPVTEGTEEYTLGDRRFQVTVWEPRDCEADLHVLYLGTALYMPWPMQKRSVELLARYVCGQASAKIFVLNELSVNPAFMSRSLCDLQAHFLALVNALPLKKEFVLVDNSSGLGTCLLWSLQERISGALVLNPMGWFDEGFYGGEEYQRLCQEARARSEHFVQRDVGTASQLVSSVLFSDGASDVKSACEEYRQMLAIAPSAFWSFHARMADWCFAEATPRFKVLKKLQGCIPIVLACGSHSPDVLVQQTVRRLQQHIESSVVAHIPDSKQWWEAEGKEQRMMVASLLLGVLKRASGEDDGGTPLHGGEGSPVPDERGEGRTVVLTDHMRPMSSSPKHAAAFRLTTTYIEETFRTKI